MDFDAVSYIMGHKKGEEDGASVVTITGSLIATDDGDGNITLTEVTNG